MKKLSLFILLITAICASCGSDDDAAVQETAQITAIENVIVGTWELTARKQLGVDSTLDDCETTSTIQFNANKTYTEKTFVDISSVCVSDGEFTGSWSISGDILTLMFNEAGTLTTNTPKFIITTTDELILTFDETEDTYKKK